MLAKLKSNWVEILLVFTVLLVSGFVHAYNMFGFPYFESDEGVYLSQAWSVISHGKLAPYTYWYDHAPAGWILTAIWLLISGGIFTFGFSLNSARVMMLIIHVLSSYLVVSIAKKITGKYYAGIIGVLMFSLSPLAVYFQRRLLLDNIMIFWVLFAYSLIIGKNRKLAHYLISAILFGIAVLTKENAVFFIPGFLYTVYSSAHPHHKSFAAWLWIFIFGITASTYVLYALFKNELFPTGTWLGGSENHVSLMETLQFQFSRPGGSFFDPVHSQFWNNLFLWIKQDPALMVLGIVSQLILAIVSLVKRNKSLIGFCLLSFGFWFYLARGGMVIEFYILPLIPLLSLSVGILSAVIFKKPYLHCFFIIPAIMIYYFFFGQKSPAFPQTSGGYSLYTTNQTSGQKEAIVWIRNHIDSGTAIAIDQYSYLELTDPKNPSGIIFPNAVWYLKVDHDSEVDIKVDRGSPNTFDLVAKTPQMQVDLWGGASKTVSDVLNNSVYIKGFNTNGWGVEFWSNQNFSQILENTWQSYRQRFLKDHEKSIDPMKSDITTSEGQSYAMLRSVWQSDPETFEKVWSWTKSNLQNSADTFSWKYGNGVVLDSGSASDADTDIALSLLFAYKKWNNPAYLNSAKKIIDGIWHTEVREFNGKNYLIPGNWAKTKPELILNVSYFFPSAYRIFSEVDPSHDWMGVVDSSYEALINCTANLYSGESSSVGLPPNWCAMSSDGNYFISKEEGISSTDYSYDSVRTMWRIGVDYRWYNDQRAFNFLENAGIFMSDYWLKNHEIAVGYSHDGKPLESYESVLAYSSVLPIFSNTDPLIASDIYRQKILPKLFIDQEKHVSYWEDAGNYYLQNWSWFNVAYYANQLPDLWNNQ